MAKLTDKSALITPANDDLLYIVDVSDTTDSGQGTSKKIEFQNLVTNISYPSLLSKPSLGSLAPLDYLAYDSLVSKPSLGSLAPLNELSYQAFVSKPSLGSLAPLNELSYAALVSKPSLGSLAPLNTITAPYLNYSGFNNQILSVNSAVSTGLSWITQPLTFRNILINGDMSVAQRSTSTASITTNGYYTADRWLIFQNFGTVTQSVENDAPTGTGLRKSLKNTFTTGKAALAAGDLFLVRQLIEGLNLQNVLKGTSNAKPLIASFWVKASVTGTYVVELFDSDSSPAETLSKQYTINTANTWEFKTITFEKNTSGSFDNDNLQSLTIQWGVAAGTNFTSGTLQANWGAVTTANRYVGQVNGAAANNNFFQITGVQLEAADEASEFEKVPYDINLLRCLRYCFVLPNTGDVQNGPVGQLYDTTKGFVWFKFPVKMRATPTGSNIGTGVGVMRVAYSTGSLLTSLFSSEAAYLEYTNIANAGTIWQTLTQTGSGTFSAEL